MASTERLQDIEVSWNLTNFVVPSKANFEGNMFCQHWVYIYICCMLVFADFLNTQMTWNLVKELSGLSKN